ncbi:MAG: hypothetical protein ACT4OY_01230 [Alphaproteobacteria bacterium]
MPDSKKGENQKITPELLATLRDYKARTGVAVMALLNKSPEDVPQGLTSTLINSWLEGKTKSARKAYLEYVLNEWRVG